MEGKYELAIIVPVYNAEDSLGESVQSLIQFRGNFVGNLQIIFVNDGSTDDSYSKLVNLTSNLSFISVINLESNKGKGFALKKGISFANAKYVGFTDIDLPYGMGIFNSTYNKLNDNADLSMVYGSRHHADSEPEQDYGIVRKIGRKFFSNIVRAITPTDVKDTQCGFKMMKEGFAQKVVESSIVNRFAFDIELFMVAHANNKKISPVSVSLNHTKESSVRIVVDTIRMIYDIIRIRYAYHTKHY